MTFNWYLSNMFTESKKYEGGIQNKNNNKTICGFQNGFSNFVVESEQLLHSFLIMGFYLILT